MYIKNYQIWSKNLIDLKELYLIRIVYMEGYFYIYRFLPLWLHKVDWNNLNKIYWKYATYCLPNKFDKWVCLPMPNKQQWLFYIMSLSLATLKLHSVPRIVALIAWSCARCYISHNVQSIFTHLKLYFNACGLIFFNFYCWRIESEIETMMTLLILMLNHLQLQLKKYGINEKLKQKCYWT